MTDATTATTTPQWLIDACKPWVVQLMPDGYNSAFGLTAEEVAANVWPRLNEAIEHLEWALPMTNLTRRNRAIRAALACLRGET